MQYRRPSAEIRSSRIIPVIAIILGLLTLWAIRHIYHIVKLHSETSSHNLEFIYAGAFLVLCWSMSLAILDRPKKVSKSEQTILNRLSVVAIIPAYNEDPLLLERCISSIIIQSRKPQKVIIIDDGSNQSDYSEVKKWAFEKGKSSGVKILWKRTPNGGKRHAQYTAINMARRANIYLTVDSDSVLDKNAIKEGLKPFIDPRVKSVAGVVMLLNSQKNFLTRFTDLWFVMGQMVDRAAMSTMGSVLVNSGALAFYDGKVIRKNLEGYINELFFGQRIELSDDSLLTLYAIAEGKAVSQTSSFAFSAMPENISHHLRQYVRWMRGAFIRTFWRFKYLPLNGYGYWTHLLGWIQMFISLFIFFAIFVITPAITGKLLPVLILVPILVGYGEGLFYLTIKRSDVSFKSQMLTYSTSIFATFWSFFVLRFVRWYAIVTCRKAGWGTRETVEVTA